MSPRQFNCLASTSLLALILLGLAWELWLAPVRPGGSWLVLKVLPLLAPLLGTLHGRRYTHQWSSLLSLLYVAEGLVRSTSDSGMSALLAAAQVGLATSWFVACVGYARATRGP